jgi:protein kinase A
MELLVHPLVLRLYECYQDANALYMLLELVPGGELWTILHGDVQVLKKTSTGGVVVDTAKFYAANVLTALDFMHHEGVAYRDLKPENLVLDNEGYLRVIDLGFAKYIGEGGKSNTLCGTPEYLAPELVLSKGHGTPVDIWALGILIFELLTSNTPFADDDATVMFQKVGQCRCERQARYKSAKLTQPQPQPNAPPRRSRTPYSS